VTCIENDECSVCPSVSKPDEIADLMKGFVLENRRITVHEVCYHVGNFVWVSLDHS
jgi:hypothetical protein